MGRKISDGKAIDVEAPADEEILFGELYCIDRFTGFAMSDIGADDDDRDFALEQCDSIWAVKVPTSVAVTRGHYVKWTDPTAFQFGGDDLANEASSGTPTVNTVAQVETPRNSDGYARLKLRGYHGG